MLALLCKLYHGHYIHYQQLVGGTLVGCYKAWKYRSQICVVVCRPRGGTCNIHDGEV